jgi:hypothetical protein
MVSRGGGGCVSKDGRSRDPSHLHTLTRDEPAVGSCHKYLCQGTTRWPRQTCTYTALDHDPSILCPGSFQVLSLPPPDRANTSLLVIILSPLSPHLLGKTKQNIRISQQEFHIPFHRYPAADPRLARLSHLTSPSGRRRWSTRPRSKLQTPDKRPRARAVAAASQTRKHTFGSGTWAASRTERIHLD